MPALSRSHESKRDSDSADQATQVAASERSLFVAKDGLSSTVGSRMSRVLTYAGVFLVAMATLMLEILLTRITSVSAWYHLAFFVISLGMLGMTAGAVLVFVFPKLFTPDRVAARLAQSALGFAVATPLCIGMALAMPLAPVTDLMTFMALLGTGGVLALPFILAGTTLALALTRAGLPPNIAYGFDLVGAALGCVAIIPLLDVIDAPSGALAAAAVGALGAAAFAFATGRLRWLSLGAAGVLALLAAGNATAHPSPLRPAWVKGVRETPQWFSFLRWNTYSRVTVSPSYVQAPSFWAPVARIPPDVMRPMEQRTILIDGAAGTVIVRLGDSLADHAYLAWDATAFAHRLRPTGPAAVIGVGGGRDVLEAARVGHDPVVGVEINGLIVGLHREDMKDFSGLTKIPSVQLVYDEARSFMARETRQFNVLTMSLIDTWASTGAGAYSLSENGLYTREAWQIFLRRLAPNGIFTVSRWYNEAAPGETARMLGLAMETLYSIGVERPLSHLVLLQTNNVATLLMSREPFSAADIDKVHRDASLIGLNVLLTPRDAPKHPTLAQLVQQPTREAMWAWSSEQQLDLTPPTDQRPFFFSMLKPRTWLTNRDTVNQMDLSFLGNLQATQTLVYAALVAVVLTLVTVLWPMWSRRRDFPALARADVLASGGYFALIGLGFMFVEIGLLSRLNVFLGRPTLALAVLLAGIIFFTGLGSMLSGRVSFQRKRLAVFYPWIPAALIGLTSLALPWAMHTFETGTTAVRVMVSLCLLAPTALALGLGFPLGLGLCERMEQRALGTTHGAALGPWLWGINGACGVCASGLALGVSMVFGVNTTLLVGAACYIALPLATARLYKSGN